MRAHAAALQAPRSQTLGWALNSLFLSPAGLPVGVTLTGKPAMVVWWSLYSRSLAVAASTTVFVSFIWAFLTSVEVGFQVQNRCIRKANRSEHPVRYECPENRKNLVLIISYLEIGYPPDSQRIGDIRSLKNDVRFLRQWPRRGALNGLTRPCPAGACRHSRRRHLLRLDRGTRKSREPRARRR